MNALFPATDPGRPEWSWPATEPIYGPEARRDLGMLALHDQLRLAERLIKAIKKLLYSAAPSRHGVLIPDPPGVGPRYFVDIREGYVAVYWVLEPPPHVSGAGPALWIERVLTRAEVEQALRDQAVN
jgi:hypothetical protein